MKTITLIALFAVCLVLCNQNFSQDISNHTYKIVALDNSGIPIFSTYLKIRFSILSGYPEGIIEYREHFNVKSDSSGLIVLTIGTGINRIGKFVNPRPSNDIPFIKIELQKEKDNEFWTSYIGQFSYFQNQENTNNINKKGGHYIGEMFGGGIIFYLDETGEHGLIAATNDQSNGAQWGCLEKSVEALDLLDGVSNTKKIVEQCGYKTAAGICESLKLNGHDDWYLPAQGELRFMYEQRMKIGGFAAVDYCSSSEFRHSREKFEPIDCWVIQFGKEGKLIHYHKKSYYNVRAIRKF